VKKKHQQMRYVFVCVDVGWNEASVHSASVWHELSLRSKSESSREQ